MVTAFQPELHPQPLPGPSGRTGQVDPSESGHPTPRRDARPLPYQRRHGHREGMATVAADVDIRATPEAILDVLADLPHYPEWSAVHKRTHVDSRTADGRPQRATMAVAAAGLTDEQTIDYHWHADGVDWDLVRSGQQRGQHGLY